MRLISLRAFRVFSFVEAVSFLLLLFGAMPLKYLADQAWAVSVVGAAHGAIFLVYLVLGGLTAWKFGWGPGRWAGAFAAAVLPFGPFVFDRWLSLRSGPGPSPRSSQR